MECTQRLECTQELYGTQSERICSEQIGFLGICGNKYPVIKGPNKIGRDPQTCSIVLNLNSVSRQHAVLNILNKKDFMLMDLDSANKTKLSGKALKPYIPHPIHDGDTVQFGEIFGIFRLLEEDDDLPMTQALDIPDTPVPTKLVSRVNAATTVPESPDVSDRDDSFIVPSQPKIPQFRSTKLGKTKSIQPIVGNKIDNVYWNSSKKSTSLTLDDSDSLNDSVPSVLKEKENIDTNDIHELETQQLFAEKRDNDSPESIYTANTQAPGNGPSIYADNTQMPTGSPSIHSLNTQLPCRTSSINSLNTQTPGAFGLPSIHNLDTQPPGVLPDVCKINKQQDLQFDLCAKENNVSAYDAETEEYIFEKENVPVRPIDSPESKKTNKLNTSEEEVLFNEVDNGPVEELESQAILTEDIDLPINKLLDDSDPQSQIVKPKCAKRNMRIQSSDSTDCEDIDILPTQVIPSKKVDDEDTDCEDAAESKSPQTKINKPSILDDDQATQDLDFDYYNAPPKTKEVDLDDIPTQVIDTDIEKLPVVRNTLGEKDNASKSKELDFEDLPTQVLDTDNIEVPVKNPVVGKEVTKITEFEDLPTQVLEEDGDKSYDNNQYSEEIVISPFKVPSNSALKAKKKEKLLKLKSTSDLSKSATNENYYKNTQDVLDELCTQKVGSPELTKSNVQQKSSIPNNMESPKQSGSNSGEEDVNKFVSKLTIQNIKEMIGVGSPVAKPVKVSSDGSTSSDLEATPKKSRIVKVMNTDLPNSQEIKTGVSLSCQSLVTESSSESETENNSDKQATPLVHVRRKKKSISSAVLNVTKKLVVENLPTRVLTRPRKPTAKFLEAHCSTSILKPTYLSGQEGDLDQEIITENITRLRNEKEKSKLNKTKESSRNETKKDQLLETVQKKPSSKKSVNNEEKVEKSEDTKSINDKKRNSKEPNNNSKERASKTSDVSADTKIQLDSTVVSHNLTRSSVKRIESEISSDTVSPIQTRSKRNTKNTKAEDQSTNTSNQRSKTEKRRSPERSQTDKRKRTTKKPECRSPSPRSTTQVVRRSKRQKTKEEAVQIKSILKSKGNLEQSAVYNNSGSNSESPRSSKRPALDNSEEPCSKKTRKTNVSLRATPARMARTQYVLFTAFPVDEVKNKLEKMGAVIVTDVMKCTVLLTLQIKRTFKLLCAVGLGKPIVGPNWVQACADTNMIVDPWLYIIRDEVAEKRFQFSLERTLVGRRNFLHGYNVSATPAVMPGQSEMKLIVECSGGKWQEGGPKWLCVTCSADKHMWPALNKLGATLVTTELILGGVLRQKLDIDGNKVLLIK